MPGYLQLVQQRWREVAPSRRMLQYQARKQQLPWTTTYQLSVSSQGETLELIMDVMLLSESVVHDIDLWQREMLCCHKLESPDATY